MVIDGAKETEVDLKAHGENFGSRTYNFSGGILIARTRSDESNR